MADGGRRGNDLGGIFYPGGTTGFPKGVMLSHDALLFNGLWFGTLGVVPPGTTCRRCGCWPMAARPPARQCSTARRS